MDPIYALLMDGTGFRSSDLRGANPRTLLYLCTGETNVCCRLYLQPAVYCGNVLQKVIQKLQLIYAI